MNKERQKKSTVLVFAKELCGTQDLVFSTLIMMIIYIISYIYSPSVDLYRYGISHSLHKCARHLS